MPTIPVKADEERAKFTPLPTALKGKSVQYRFEAITTSSDPPRTWTVIQSEKLRFAKNSDDVYEFSAKGTEGQFSDSGFIFKVNLEIDFTKHPERTPPDFQMMQKRYVGIITYRNGVLTVTREMDLNGDRQKVTRSETAIQFSPDFKACSVIRFASEGWLNLASRFTRSIECKVEG